MIKRIGKIFAVLVALFVIMNPYTVSADVAGSAIKTISGYNTGVGGEVVLIANGTYDANWDLEFSYDENIFEYVEAYESLEKFFSEVPRNEKYKFGSITVDNSNDKLYINYVNTKTVYDTNFIVVKFKVKAAPATGTADIVVNSSFNGFSNETKNFSFKVTEEKQCPTCPACEKDEVSCPVCEECEKCEVAVDTNKETTSSESKGTDSKDILLYSALGACGFLAVVVVILAFRKK